MGRISVEELENLLDDLMSTYDDRYERLKFLAEVYVALTRLAQQEGFGGLAVADYAAALLHSGE
jgi:hypothetical protein